MKFNRWIMTSALLFSVKSFAGYTPEQPQQEIQDVDVAGTIDELRRKCEIYEQHDQIYPFKIKVNFRGRFVRIIKKPYCATFENTGSYTRKLTMKYNRFNTPDEQGDLSWRSQLQVPCGQYFAQKYETLNKGPLLSFDLASCSDINTDTIRQQTMQQLSELINSETSQYLVASSEQLQLDTCQNLQEVALVQPGDCPIETQEQK